MSELKSHLKTEKETLRPSHPLQASENAFEENRFKAEMEQLRRVQGLHAPLKIAMERNAVKNVGHFACIVGHGQGNVLDDVLSGRDEDVGPSAMFGGKRRHETLSTPHDVIENSLGSKF